MTKQTNLKRRAKKRRGQNWTTSVYNIHRGVLGTTVKSGLLAGYVWTGEFDSNTLRVDAKFYKSTTKNIRIQTIRIRLVGVLVTFKINVKIYHILIIQFRPTSAFIKTFSQLTQTVKALLRITMIWLNVEIPIPKLVVTIYHQTDYHLSF